MTKARDLANAGTALSAVSATELAYLDGVTSAVQTQLDTKQPTVSGVSDTEIGYLDGVTSAIQTQLNAKAPTASPTFTGNVTSGASFVLPNDNYLYWGPGDGSTSIQGNSTTDFIAFGAASAERMRINSSGVTINAVADATTTTAARGGGYMGIPQSAAATTGSTIPVI